MNPALPTSAPRPRAVALRPRATAAVLLASVIGAAAFTWPLLADPGSTLVGLRDAPLLFGVLLVLVIAVVLAEIADDGMDAKAVAVLGVLTAVGAAIRPLGTGIAGFEPVFFLLVLAGRVYGPGFGFVLGATTLFASALTTAGVGPWLPYQMLGAAWIAAGAGVLPRRLRGGTELAVLAAYAFVAGLLYGLLLNLSFWPFVLAEGTGISFVPGDPVTDNLRRFVVFTAVTSLGFDLPRAVVTAGLVLLTGRPLLRALRRASRRAAFGVGVVFDESVGDRPAPPSRSASPPQHITPSTATGESEPPSTRPPA